MCTVTRPGLAAIAASTAVELLVSLLQHPDGYVARCKCRSSWFTYCYFLSAISVLASAPPVQTGRGHDGPDRDSSGSVLGLVPHQLRGFLAEFRAMPIVGAAYHRCTGCSETVREHSQRMRMRY